MLLLYYVSFMFIWQRRFLEGYNTVIGKTVYITDITIDTKNWDKLYLTMRHEFIHMLQDDKYGLLFKVAYLFPQLVGIFSILALLAIWFSNFWLLSLVALAALAPWPAPFRAKWELEGYTQSLLAMHEGGEVLGEHHLEWVVKQFVTAKYYFMRWGRASIEADVRSIIGRIKTGQLSGMFLHYK